MIIDYTDALEQKWHIFPLHKIMRSQNGTECGCGDAECETVGKHPKNGGWQHTPLWDAEQLSYLEDEDGFFFGNQFLDGYGIVVSSSGLLVVDVDGRNGGFESAKKLDAIRAQCGFIVQSGSGYGEHWYFKNSSKEKLLTNVKTLGGIDFKSTGYVVGCGSEHKSGDRYSVISGSPASITEAPPELIDILKRKEQSNKKSNESNFYTSFDELRNIIRSIKNEGRDYEKFISIGMGIHTATNGSEDGYKIWLEWSSKSDYHNDTKMDMKWHSFGKSNDPISTGTLYKMALEDGYIAPVEFVDDTEWEEIKDAKKSSYIDLLSPPGLAGDITRWINSRSIYPRPQLAVAASLQIISNAAGLNYLVSGQDTSINLITLGIAGSRTGKGMIKRCIDEVHQSLGLLPAVHGKFKSSQELIRNAMQHQIVAYVYDEFGKQLEKVSGASKSGAHYLEDLLAEVIAIYSVATGIHGISGDVKREMVQEAEKAIAREAKKAGIEDGENIADLAKRKNIEPLLAAIKSCELAKTGLVEPYLSFFGLTEPNSFTAALEKDPWLITGGFLGRALIFEELDNVPKEKELSEISREPLGMAQVSILTQMLNCGEASSKSEVRIERKGEWRYINWSEDAIKLLSQVKMYWREKALAEQDIGSGLESQALGAPELTIKVAGILSAHTEIITKESLEWAHELIKKITHDKIDRAKNNELLSSNDSFEKGGGLLAAVMRHINSLPDGLHTTAGKARQAAGRSKVTLEDAKKALDYLCEKGSIRVEQSESKSGKKIIHYFKK